MAKCTRCNGDGWIVVPVCCGREAPCCGQPDPEQEQCPTCAGSGETEGELRWMKCETCGGEGGYFKDDTSPFSGYWYTCKHCDGEKWVLVPVEPVTLEDLEENNAPLVC